MRKEAGGCLLNLLKDAKVQRTPECRPLLEQRSSELLFCPDRETRTFLVHFLSRNQNSEDRLPSSLLIEHLSSMYRTQTLEINKTTFHQGFGCFIKRGMFQRRTVIIKKSPNPSLTTRYPYSLSSDGFDFYPLKVLALVVC